MLIGHHHSRARAHLAAVSIFVVGLTAALAPDLAAQTWASYGRDAQHSALSSVGSQLPTGIRWSIPVDLDPQYSGNGDLYTHYGSPAITSENTVLVPQKIGAAGGFQVKALSGTTGQQVWSLATDYVLPNHNWIPPMGITLLPGESAVAIPGAGGTVLLRKDPNSSSSRATVNRFAFYGKRYYNQDPTAFGNSIQICTPITSDHSGTLYFGFVSDGQALPGYPDGITSGLARVAPNGTGSFVAAAALCNDQNIQKVVYNCAPALSTDGTRLYVAVNNGGYGYLCAVDPGTLQPVRSVLLTDPCTAANAWVSDDGTASPTVGPDGDVYFGVLESNFPGHHARGWLLHFSSDLTASKTPGSFGWDDSASIVPKALVPSYTGPSSYLVLTKYNNYADPGIGGDGKNKVAVLDPNVTMKDPIESSTNVMNEVLTIVGPTANPQLGGVDEWCINSAAIDPVNKCAVVNSEDGHVYRWSFVNNTLSAGLELAPPTGEAYTSTLIGPDGAVYAINNAQLFCCDYQPRRGHPSANPPAFFHRDRPWRFDQLGFHGALWIGILAAFSLHAGIWASRRLRIAPGSFLSRWGVSRSSRSASVASSTAS